MKQVSYRWHLAELMARNGMHNTTDLAPRLREHGVDLSPSQVYRLVTQTPDRVSLKMFGALCSIFDCELEDLVTFTYAEQQARRASAGSSVVDLNKVGRPRRARVIRDDH
jgi:DNA-binding Xre family transcriptional regulator